MLESLCAFVSICEAATGALNLGKAIYNTVGGIATGDEYSRAINSRRGQVERLADHILYAHDIHVVQDATPNRQQQYRQLKNCHDILVPIQQSIQRDIISSPIISIPDKVKTVVNKCPWDLFPAPAIPIQYCNDQYTRDQLGKGLVPVLFRCGNQQFIGWQAMGLLTAMDLDYDPSRWHAPSMGQTPSEINPDDYNRLDRSPYNKPKVLTLPVSPEPYLMNIVEGVIMEEIEDMMMEDSMIRIINDDP